MMEQPKTEPAEPRPAEAPKGQDPIGEIDGKVLRVREGENDIIIVKLDHQPYRGEMEELEQTIKHVTHVTKVLCLRPGYEVEVIPRKERHYGVWCKKVEHWAECGDGSLISSPCLGVIRCEQKHILAESEVREFNDDGTPGEAV